MQSFDLQAIAFDLHAQGLFDPSVDTLGVLENPEADAESAFEAFHWGETPKRGPRPRRLPDFSELYEIGELVRVEYLTTKGGERAIWVHDFSRPYPVLTATPKGRLGPILGGRARVTPRGIVD